MKNRFSFLLLALAALAASALVVSCEKKSDVLAKFSDPSQGSEILKEANQALLDGNSEAAMRFYLGLVVAQPTNALARLQFGTFLQDQAQGNPELLFEAIGEYRAFLHLAPDSEMAPAVSNSLNRAWTDLMSRRVEIRANKLSDEKLAESDAAVAAANAARDAAVKEANEARRALDAIRAERDRLFLDANSWSNRYTILSSQVLPEMPKEDFTKPLFDAHGITVAPAAKPNPRPQKPTHFYRVQSGDSLWLISQREYGTPARTEEIRLANPGIVGPNGELKEGSTIKIP